MTIKWLFNLCTLLLSRKRSDLISVLYEVFVLMCEFLTCGPLMDFGVNKNSLESKCKNW